MGRSPSEVRFLPIFAIFKTARFHAIFMPFLSCTTRWLENGGNLPFQNRPGLFSQDFEREKKTLATFFRAKLCFFATTAKVRFGRCGEFDILKAKKNLKTTPTPTPMQGTTMTGPVDVPTHCAALQGG
jgi:hypothetical protein